VEHLRNTAAFPRRRSAAPADAAFGALGRFGAVYENAQAKDAVQARARRMGVLQRLRERLVWWPRFGEELPTEPRERYPATGSANELTPSFASSSRSV
jgi:hypothetical protein